MRGTDWPRRKAAGAIRIGEARPATVTLTVDNRSGAFTARGEPMRCPCGVIYSRCYYGH